MRRVTPLQLRQTVTVKSGLDAIEITPYYAGHVLGAVMFRIAVNDASVVYTGDFNSVAERHLGAASIPRFVPVPDVLITESTYATSVHSSRTETEHELTNAVSA
jgi:integrator complex subunit 11